MYSKRSRISYLTLSSKAPLNALQSTSCHWAFTGQKENKDGDKDKKMKDGVIPAFGRGFLKIFPR